MASRSAKPLMAALFPDIKLLHIVCVAISGTLFSLRGVMMAAGSAHVNHVCLRFSSYAVDTTLLGAALVLAYLSGQLPLPQAWLTAKILLLFVYIFLGVRALRPGRARKVRVAYFAAALGVFGFIISIAVTHDPRGFLRSL